MEITATALAAARSRGARELTVPLEQWRHAMPRDGMAHTPDRRGRMKP